MPRLQGQLNPLSEKKSRIRDEVPHLSKVFDGQIGDRVGIDLARVIKFLKHAPPVCAVTVQQFQELRAVFEAAIKPLPEERNNGMGRITQKKRPAFHVPRRAFDRDHRSSWVCEEIIGEMCVSGTTSGKRASKNLTT